MRVTLLGFTVPKNEIEDIFKLGSNMPIQTHKFAWSVVRSLAKNNIQVELLSSYPVTNFPHTNKIIFNKKNIYDKSANGIIMPFANIIILKHVTRFLSCLIYGISRIYNFKSDLILIHGVHSPFLYFGLIVKILLKKKIIVILTDPPSEENFTDTYFSSFLKKLDKILIKKSLCYFDGAIALTEKLAQDFTPSVPYLIIEGILDESAILNNPEEEKYQDKKIILYAGGLYKNYGLDLLLESFKEIPCENICLKVFGKGDFESHVIKAAEKDKRIIFGGFCSNSEVLTHMKSADILINTRPSDQEFVKYSFPSKIIEYMSTGTPVLTTNLPGIPDEYKKHLYIIKDETKEGISRSISTLLQLSKEDLQIMGKSAKGFIESSKNEREQGRKILNFFLEVKNNRD